METKYPSLRARSRAAAFLTIRPRMLLHSTGSKAKCITPAYGVTLSNGLMCTASSIGSIPFARTRLLSALDSSPPHRQPTPPFCAGPKGWMASMPRVGWMPCDGIGRMGIGYVGGLTYKKKVRAWIRREKHYGRSHQLAWNAISPQHSGWLTLTHPWEGTTAQRPVGELSVPQSRSARLGPGISQARSRANQEPVSAPS